MSDDTCTRRFFLRASAVAASSTALVTGASGQSSSESVVVIDGTETAGRIDYEFTVSGEVTGRSTAMGATLNSRESIDGFRASGVVIGGRDAFTFTGEITSFEANGAPIVYVDGVERPELVASYPHTIVVDGTDADFTAYEFAVTGDVLKSTASGASINRGDTLDGTNVRGSVHGGRDAYEFSGEISEFWTDGGSAVLVDGEPYATDPFDVVTVEKDDSADTVTYEVAVSGQLRKSTANGASINNFDTVSGSTATGRVAGGTDSYAFTGEITAVSPKDRLRITVNGEPYPADDGAPSTLAGQIEQAIHTEVNARRAEHGLDSLAYSDALGNAARKHSQDMVENDYFAHVAPGDGSFADHYTDEGVSCAALGENILYRSQTASTADAIAANAVAQWMGSQPHRESILRERWTVEGLGVVLANDDLVYATQAFGKGC